MNTILIWILVIIASGLFVYFVPYRNIKIIQKLQREGLQKLDNIIDLLKKKDK
jgi:amino acid transporter